MSSHPINLAIRFILELLALTIMGIWGWRKGGEEWWRFLLVIGIPLAMATIWGVFAVPDDPSRSGNAPVVTPGLVRVIIEFIFFGIAIWALFNLGNVKMSLIFGVVVLLHYALSYDRILWLLSH
jgi:hypothetical protein